MSSNYTKNRKRRDRRTEALYLYHYGYVPKPLTPEEKQQIEEQKARQKQFDIKFNIVIKALGIAFLSLLSALAL
jgi:hypothetical protein